MPASMPYPQHVVKVGEPDAAVVRALKLQLNKMLALDADAALRLDPSDPNFGPRMKNVVKLFQARHVDSEGRTLRQDGEVGSITWEALFGSGSVSTIDAARGSLLADVLRRAAVAEANEVRERPKNSNRGPEVDAYLRRTGVSPGLAWCCAFIYFCFDEAALALARANPMMKTAGCLAHWNGAVARGAARILAARAVDDPGLLRPGMIFIMDFGRGAGHTGLIEEVSGGLLTTLEGNTDASKTREGGGVYRLTRRVAEINKGFIDYAGL